MQLTRMIRRAWLAVILLFGASSGGASGSILVNQWSLVTGVGGQWPNVDEVSIDTVSNPLEAVNNTSVGVSVASTAYDLSWSPGYGRFGFQVNHSAAGVDPLLFRSISNGYIDFRSDHDLLFSMNANYTYNLPCGNMQGGVQFVVDNGIAQPFQQYFVLGGGDDTFLQAPRSGTFDLAGGVLLPAGTLYRFDYTAELDVYGPVGCLATGDGGFQFSLQEVPEPSGLAVVLLAVIKRSRRSRI